jgi:phosphoribosylformylglycinamidine cyclo-ligase
VAKSGGIAETEMLRTFNCGIGMIVIAARDHADDVDAALSRGGETPIRIGEMYEAESGPRVTTSGHLAL